MLGGFLIVPLLHLLPAPFDLKGVVAEKSESPGRDSFFLNQVENPGNHWNSRKAKCCKKAQNIVPSPIQSLLMVHQWQLLS